MKSYRFTAYRSFFIVSLFCATVVGSRVALAGEFSGIRKNNKGVSLFTAQKPVEAYGKFTDALVDLPYSGPVHFNIATSFLINKDFEKALNENSLAIRLSPGDSNAAKDTRFFALFNSAVALTELKRTDEALELYQQALQIKPDSVETKTNIELLTQNGGQGGGEGKDPKQPNDKEGEGEGDKENPKFQNKPKEKPQPKPFKSEELNQQDVSKILEELKRQEEQVRDKMQNEGAKDAPADKDW